MQNLAVIVFHLIFHFQMEAMDVSESCEIDQCLQPKTYIDNALNRCLGRVGKPIEIISVFEDGSYEVKIYFIPIKTMH